MYECNIHKSLKFIIIRNKNKKVPVPYVPDTVCTYIMFVFLLRNDPTRKLLLFEQGHYFFCFLMITSFYREHNLFTNADCNLH